MFIVVISLFGCRAIAASGFIPCGSGCAPYVTFRNKPMVCFVDCSLDFPLKSIITTCYNSILLWVYELLVNKMWWQIDGGFAVSFAELCPTGIKRCIAMESYYIGPYRKSGGGECNEKVEQETDSEEMRVLFCNLPPPKGMKTVPTGSLPLACPVVLP